MNIHYAKKSDIPDLVPLIKAWAKMMEYDVDPIEIEIDLKRVHKDGVVIFATDGDNIIGVMNGIKIWHFWVKKWIAHEHWFFVHPKHRGKGVAALLEQAFLMWAKLKECESIILSPNQFGTMDPEQAAVTFKKYGYHLHGVLMRKEI